MDTILIIKMEVSIISRVLYRSFKAVYCDTNFVTLDVKLALPIPAKLEMEIIIDQAPNLATPKLSIIKRYKMAIRKI